MSKVAESFHSALIFSALVVAAFALWPAAVFAGDTQAVHITTMGCTASTGENICWIQIDGGYSTPTFPSGCSASGALIQFSTATQDGRNALQQLTAAFLAGKRVILTIANSCYAGYAGRAQLSWFFVLQ